MDTKPEEVGLDTQESIHTFLWRVKFRGVDGNPSFHLTTAVSKR